MDEGEAGQPLFFIDRQGDPGALQDFMSAQGAPEINFIPLDSPNKWRNGSRGQGRQRGRGKATAAFSRNKSNGKRNGKRKPPRYGFAEDSFIRPRTSDDDRDSDELAAWKDYLENASDGDFASVSALATLSIDPGPGFSQESDVDSSSDDDDIEMAEAGIHENLMQAGDGFAPNVDTSNDSDSDVDKAFEMLAARRDFTGGKSTWNTDPSAMAEDVMFSQILQAKFKKSNSTSSTNRKGKGKAFTSSAAFSGNITFIKSTGNSVDLDPELLETLGLGESDEASEEEGVPPSVTKSAARRARKTERKSERSAKRSQRKALEEEQSRIAKSIGKLRPGDAIDGHVIRVLHDINRTLFDFASPGEDFSDELLGSAPLPPMASALRRLVKEMCMHYRILPKTHGSGKKKVLLMVRTGTTRIPDNWKNVVETVVGRGTNGIVKGNTKMGPRPQPGALKKKKPPGAPDDRAAPRPGTIVGQNAAPIAADNVGHKMLLAMGWTPGSTLGASQAGENAITQPLEVTVRHKRKGLGAD